MTNVGYFLNLYRNKNSENKEIETPICIEPLSLLLVLHETRIHVSGWYFEFSRLDKNCLKRHKKYKINGYKKMNKIKKVRGLLMI